jgi:hypothetical protein
MFLIAKMHNKAMHGDSFFVTASLSLQNCRVTAALVAYQIQ